eukprot:gnl/TRDRNA2_/TRDRNA2_180029_c0_seq1.p1 gnl/TRDRNA2_/TRDRNA2_180029_c0~~gnl/TRDRNA2_/TRDRNA2_180029_c0_seq1.p1  ORF type:complete len:617 (+),score=145.44 gnl/TRDRNA2_/TRDRNA2_180029_c0_seq1:71-1921(+)
MSMFGDTFMTFVEFLSSAPCSVHGTAFLLGAAAYLTYSALSGFSWPNASQQPRRLFTGKHRWSDIKRVMALVVAMVAVGLAIALSSAPASFDECAADHDVAEISMPSSPSPPSVQVSSPNDDNLDDVVVETKVTTTPSKLLARAHAPMNFRKGANMQLLALQACVQWEPAQGAVEPMKEFFDQLECIGELLESPRTSGDDAVRLLARGRSVLETLHARAAESMELWNSTQAEWARISYNSLQLRCTSIQKDLLAIPRPKASSKEEEAGEQPEGSVPAKRSLAAIRMLSRLEQPFRDALAVHEVAKQILEMGSEELDELSKLRISSHMCMLKTVQEARAVALLLPQEDEQVRQAMKCTPSLLSNVEVFTVQSAEQETNGGVLFSIGEYWSELGMSNQDAPFCRPRTDTTNWMKDPESGTHVPVDLATAEEFMRKGQEASVEQEHDERAAMRALRLYKHAKFLALQHHDGAAEWRYRASSTVGASVRRLKLAAHSLARLGYFLMLRGRKTEALESVEGALKHNKDPLALYLHATLRRTLGELKTDSEVMEAKEQLRITAGKLPSKGLEDQRAAVHDELEFWHSVAAGGIDKCFDARDAANFVICLICRAFLPLPSPEQ